MRWLVSRKRIGHNRLHTARGKMSLYSDYIKERTYDHIMERPSGFATYRYINEGRSVYIVDIYTIPAARKKGNAAFLADLIANEAREAGCSEILGSVQPSAKGSTASLAVLLAYGFTLHSATNDAIIFRKDL